MPTVVSLSILVLGSVVLSLVLLFVCGKRKFIQRKECSRRDPHIPGQDTKKSIKKNIEKRIDSVLDIFSYEPRLINLETNDSFKSSSTYPPYYYRMKAVDTMKYLENELTLMDRSRGRGIRENVRVFLINHSCPGGLLESVESRLVHELCDNFDHARHHPLTFGPEEFSIFHSQLLKVLHSARNKKNLRKGNNIIGKVSSDHDSAIDEPEQEHSDDEILLSEVNFSLLHRPTSLKLVTDEDYETSV